jgi:hypothetical protein
MRLHTTLKIPCSKLKSTLKVVTAICPVPHNIAESIESANPAFVPRHQGLLLFNQAGLSFDGHANGKEVLVVAIQFALHHTTLALLQRW